jgi:TRAP-type C4-dicarboxylate transport system permease small subunit
MVRILTLLSNLAERLGIFLVSIYAFASFVVVSLEVFSRMAGNAFSWTEELARWLLVATCFIGASVALKHKKHVGVTGVLKKLPPMLQRVVLLCMYVVMSVFLVYLLQQGLEMTLSQGWQTGSVLLVSMVYVRINIPLGALLMLIHMAYFTVLLFTEKDIRQASLVE